jgi:hypothetical protein
MGKAISVIVQLVIVLVGVGWLISLIHAELTCPLILKSWLRPCTVSGEIWMLPMFTGAIGIPALLAAIVIIGAAISALVRNRVS